VTPEPTPTPESAIDRLLAAARRRVAGPEVAEFLSQFAAATAKRPDDREMLIALVAVRAD
jgi:hypothetical protein